MYINQLLGRNYNHHSTPSFSVYVAFQIQTKVTCQLLLVLMKTSEFLNGMHFVRSLFYQQIIIHLLAILGEPSWNLLDN